MLYLVGFFFGGDIILVILEELLKLKLLKLSIYL